MMYKRIEDIKNEKLEWDQGTEPSKKVKVVMPSGSRKQRSSQKFSVKTNVTDLSKRDVALFSMAATLILPYMLGLMLTYFLFSFYGGMSLLAFLGIDKDYFFMQLWALGSYFFITAWVIWVVLRVFTHRRSCLSYTAPVSL